jgi:hypothetical protein
MKKKRVVKKHGHEGELVAMARISRLLLAFEPDARIRILKFLLDAKETNSKPVPASAIQQVRG